MIYRLLLFLYGSNVFQFSNYLVLILCFAVLCMNQGKIKYRVGRLIGLIAIASFTYGLIYYFNFGALPISALFGRIFAPILLAWLGFNRAKGDYRCLFSDMLFIGFGEFVHGIINVFTNRNTEIIDIEGRAYNDIWGGTVSATIQNLNFIIPCSLLFYFLVVEKRKMVKYIGVVASLGGIYGTIENASRTLFYLAGLCFIVSALLYILEYKQTAKSHNLIIGGLFLLVVAIFLFQANAFGINTAFYNSALGRRLQHVSEGSSVLNNLRWVYAGATLLLLPRYLFGNIPTSHYAHNLWVDIAKETGIIPFLLYIAIGAVVVKMLIDFYRKNMLTFVERITLIPMTLAYFIVFFTEPILIGSPMTFAVFCYLWGGYTDSTEREVWKLWIINQKIHLPNPWNGWSDTLRSIQFHPENDGLGWEVE